MKLYIMGPSHNGEGAYFLMTEDGEVLADHWCSHIGFARGDLEARRPERQKEWERRFGIYQVLALGDDDMTRGKLMERNRQHAIEHGYYEKQEAANERA